MSSNDNIVGFLWVFKRKLNSDGLVERRLVVKDYTQVHGLDFSKTFSLMVRPATTRIIRSISTTSRWPLHQLDIKNAFLYGELNEEVYM